MYCQSEPLRESSFLVYGSKGTDGTYPPRWWSLETGVICWSQETGVNMAAHELIKCREVGGDPESLGG